MTKRKVFSDADSALSGVVFEGMTIMSGGFGLSGNPEHLIAGLLRSDVRGLTVISNNCGADGYGLWTLLDNGQIRKMISSYIGENKLFAELYLAGKLPLTGAGVVDAIVTELGSFDLDSANEQLIVRKLAEDVAIETVRECTGIPVVSSSG